MLWFQLEMIGDLGQHSKAHQILPIEIPMRPPSPIIIMIIIIMIIMVLIFANGKTIGSWLHWGGIAQKIWLCHPFLGPVPAKIITITSIIITIIIIIIVVVIIIIIIIGGMLIMFVSQCDPCEKVTKYKNCGNPSIPSW